MLLSLIIITMQINCDIYVSIKKKPFREINPKLGYTGSVKTMDAQAKKKMFRAKLNAKKQQQRIDSPFVRYNEHDQPVCKVCDIVIKSDSLWPAHQVSRKHHDAIEIFKANAAAALNRANNPKPAEPPKDKSNSKPESPHGVLNENSELPSTTLPPNNHSPMLLPPDFFDNREAKRQKKGRDPEKLEDPDEHNRSMTSRKNKISGSGIDSSLPTKSLQIRDPEYLDTHDLIESSKTALLVEPKQGKRALPQGFFDDKDSDLRARGITPVKPDVKDEYKEFEKLIQEDLQGVDDRMEEEEIDAAEVIEEAETVEQRTYRERVELLRKKKLELKASRSAAHGKDIEVTVKKTSDKDSSSDDESDENLIVDWRAKQL